MGQIVCPTCGWQPTRAAVPLTDEGRTRTGKPRTETDEHRERFHVPIWPAVASAVPPSPETVVVILRQNRRDRHWYVEEVHLGGLAGTGQRGVYPAVLRGLLPQLVDRGIDPMTVTRMTYFFSSDECRATLARYAERSKIEC